MEAPDSPLEPGDVGNGEMDAADGGTDDDDVGDILIDNGGDENDETKPSVVEKIDSHYARYDVHHHHFFHPPANSDSRPTSCPTRGLTPCS